MHTLRNSRLGRLLKRMGRLGSPPGLISISMSHGRRWRSCGAAIPLGDEIRILTPRA